MKSKRPANNISRSYEVTESEEVSKKPRGRPCKRRFHSSEFPLKAQGKLNGPKRTPLHLGDPFAHKEEYHVEATAIIVGLEQSISDLR